MAIFVAVLAASAPAQTLPATSPADGSKIAQRVEDFEKAHKARVGVAVVDLRTGRTCLAHRAGEALIPASNQKVLTSAFALARLGAKGMFATSVFAAGRDVIVTGQYDPLLGDPNLARAGGREIYAELDRWALAIRAKFGEAIPGDLILASRSALGEFRPPSWARRHYDRWYGAPVADLNFHDNCFDVTFIERGKNGRAIGPVVAPASRYIRVVNELQLRPGGKHLWRLRESDDGATLTLTGQIQGPAGDPLSVPMRDPRITLGRVLAERLTHAGVRVGGRLRVLPVGQVNLDKAALLAKTETPLSAVLQRANKRSLNLVAECMLLRAGDGTWPGSTKLMRDTLVERLGLDAKTLAVHDGSGLSRRNRVTPRDITKLLTRLAKSEWAEVFLASLPRSGVDGSLRRRLAGKPYRGRVAAKTGTIAGVRALSGYILDGHGRLVFAFAILANDLRGVAQTKAKRLQDRICREWIDADE